MLRDFISGKEYWFSSVRFDLPTNKDKEFDTIVFDHFRTIRQFNDLECRHKVLVSHNFESRNYETTAENTRFLSRMLYKYLAHSTRVLERQFLPKFSLIFSINSLESQWLKEHNSQVKTLHPFIRARLSDDRSRRQNELLIIGSYHYRAKRRNLLHFLSEIWPHINSQFPEIRLVIAGSNIPHLPTTTQNVRIIESPDDLHPYLSSSIAIVAPEREGGGFKMKYLDALKYNIPVITPSSSLQGTGLTSEHGFYSAESVNDYIEAISCISNEESYSKEIPTIGVHEQFTLHRFQHILESIRP